MSTGAPSLRSGLSARRCRASTEFEVVDFDSLSRTEAKRFRFLRAANPRLTSLFLPRDERASMKVASPAAAALLREMTREGARSIGSTGLSERDVACLVLDGILEVETNDGWRAGPRAAPDVLTTIPELSHDGNGAASGVSHAALKFAEALSEESPPVLAARLYRFNRRPASPDLRRRFPDEFAVAAALGLNRELSATTAVGSIHRGLEPMHTDHWLRWWLRSVREASAAPSDRRSTTVHKLYVSPGLDGLRSALAASFALFSDPMPPFAIKVGRGLSGVLRSDKLVVYFRTEEALREGAAVLMKRLGGLEPHPVPFTEDLGGAGLLSCGVDPPFTERLHGWEHDDSSWRAWVTSRLGSALAAAKRDTGHGLRPSSFALARLSIEGVDPESWKPVQELWGGRS